MTPFAPLGYALKLMPVLGVLALGTFGCQTNPAVPLQLQVKEVVDFDWARVSGDYDGEMFDIIEIALEGKRARFVGFLPSRDRYCASMASGYEPYSMGILQVGSRHNSWLFLMVTQGRLLGLLVSDTQSPAFSAPITSESMSCCRDDFAQLNDQTVYVEPAFHEVLLERGVRLPAHYQVMRHKYWDSQERQWDPEAQK